MTTPATAQLPRNADAGRRLHLAAKAAERAATSLYDAVAALRLAASADPSLQGLLETLESVHKSAADVSSRLSREDHAESTAIQARTVEVADLQGQAIRRVFSIGKEIARIKRTIELRQSMDRNQEDRLRAAGLTPSEIAATHKKMITEDDIRQFDAEIQALEAERSAIGKFLSSGPRFDPALLANTSLDPNKAPAEAA
jgi:hypothetical protein